MQDKKNDMDLLKELVEKNTKKMNITVVSDSIKESLKLSFSDLGKLKTKVEEKRKVFTDKVNIIKEKVSKLKDGGIITVNEEVTKKTDMEFAKYQNMLSHFMNEIDGELSFCKSMIADNTPRDIRVAKNASDDVEVYLNDKVSKLKKYVKKSTKDLRIGFSRYNFEFDDQVRKLDYLSAYLKADKKKPKVKSENKKESETKK